MKFISKGKKYKIVLKFSYFKIVDGMRQLVPGIRVEFRDGLFETEDKEMIKKLKAHPAYGRDFWSEEKVEKTPVAEQMEKIEKQAKQEINTSCPYCSFKAKTEFGLMSHIRAKHPKEK